ncbi:MAG: Ig-like domain-containing protein [Pseudomonadota bacterium]
MSNVSTYEFTAFLEETLLGAGSGNGSNLGYGDKFSMPASTDVTFSVTDDDPYLSGDSWNNENANDSSLQTASITADGEEVGNGGQVYGEQYFWLKGSDGNWYVMIEIEQEGDGQDYFTFYDAYGVPDPGVELTVYCGGNISCWQPHMGCLDGGDPPETPPVANEDEITIGEGESIGDSGDDAQLNILANDFDPDGTFELTDVNGEAPGAVLTVTTAGGVEVEVTVDADGNLSFDTGEDFDNLLDGQSDSFQLTYTITDNDGNIATSTVTVNIEGESTVDAVNDAICVLETEGESVNGNVLANDTSEFGEITGVVRVAGSADNVGNWVELDGGGRVRINEDGELDFDAADDFDFLTKGQSVDVDVTYTIAYEQEGAPEEYQCLFFGNQPAGTIITDQYEANGVIISSGSSSNPIMVFDTFNPTGGDGDLATNNRGNVLIISEDGDTTDPDDNAGGGVMKFDFARETEVESLVFLDNEEYGSAVRFFDENDVLIETVAVPTTSNGGQVRVDFNVSGVHRMEVELAGSGAIDNLIYTLQEVEDIYREDTATVTITVKGVNDPPVADPDAITITEGDSIGVAVDDATLNVLFNDSDPDDDPLTVSTVEGQTMPAGGSVTVMATSTLLGAEVAVTIAEDGSLTYEDDGAFDALEEGQTDTFTINYTNNDGEADSNSTTVTVNIEGVSDTQTTEYNVIFLVDSSDSTQTVSSQHALTDEDLNGDGVFGSVFDAELEAVQQYVDAFAALNLDGDLDIGIFTFDSALSVIAPNETPTQLTETLADGTEKSVFGAGDDLSGAFAGAMGDGVAVFNAAIAGANDFFASNTTGSSDNTVNLVYLLSDSFGFDWTLGGDPNLAAELDELTTVHNGFVDTLIFTDPAVTSPFVQQIEDAAGDGVVDLVEDQADLTALTDELILSGTLV